MLKKILLALVILIGVVLVIAAVKSPNFSVTRSAVIPAAPAVVFEQVNDFHKWTAWSPWEKLDPAMKRTFEGAPSGVGAVYSWSGNRDVGAGSMTITESHAAERIVIRLDFHEPMESTCASVFTFTPQGNQTLVSWTMSGKSNFVERTMCLFMSMDKYLGGQFDQGLAKLKTVVVK